jgi:Zinc-binding dehydrogenase
LTTADSPPAATRTIRFHEYGEPADVLRLEDAVVPAPSPGRIRVTVHAVALNPADWALCRGLFPGNLPRGIGLDVSGTVDAADLVLDTAPVGGALPDLVTIAGGDPRRVMTISDFAAAAALGVRSNLDEGGTPRYDVLAEYAANGKFTIPVAKTLPLTSWRTALEISQTGHARGKLILLPAAHGAEFMHGA